jgi:hypothetical protein
LAAVLSKSLGNCYVSTNREVVIDPLSRLTVDFEPMLGSVVLANEADVYGGARKDPSVVRSSKENGARLVDTFEDLAIRLTANALSR